MKTTNMPTHYYLRYEDNALFDKELKRCDGYAELCDPDNYDVATLAQARKLRRSLERNSNVTGPLIFERVNIRPLESEYSDPDDPEYEWDIQEVE